MDHTRSTRQDTSRSGESSSSQRRGVEHFRREGTRFQPTATARVKAEVQKRYGIAWGDDPQLIEAVLKSMSPGLRTQYQQEQAQMRSTEQSTQDSSPRTGAPRLVKETSRGEEDSERRTRSRRGEHPPTSYHLTPPSRPSTAFRPAEYSTNKQSPSRPNTALGHRLQRTHKFSADIFNPESTDGSSSQNYDHRQPPQSQRIPTFQNRPVVNEDVEALGIAFSRSASISRSTSISDSYSSPPPNKGEQPVAPSFTSRPAKWKTPYDSRVNMPSTSSYSTKDVNQVADPSQPSILYRDTRHITHEINEQNFANGVRARVGVKALRDYARHNARPSARKDTQEACIELLDACNDFLRIQKSSSPDLGAIDCALKIRDALNKLNLYQNSKTWREREAINELYEECKTK